MGGGSEPYTGHNLQVCNSCGEVLKKIDKVKNEDTQEVKDLFVSVMSMTDDADVKQILTDYSKSVISDSEKLVAITNESKEKAERAQNIEENFYDLEKAFKVTTGYDFEGYQIVDYKGIVSGDIVLGTGFISEFAASWSDAFGTTSNTFAGKMKTAKQKALKQLMANAMITGANAVIGIDFDYTMFGNNMLGVSANGTAVVIRKK
ncbi:YbjQ family protein [Dorea longicatena]|nr:YbjQ family protein [Dorea longicatena]